MKKINIVAWILLIIGIGGLIFSEVLIQSFNCSEVQGEVTNIDEDVLKVRRGGSRHSGPRRIENRYVYDITVKVENSKCQLDTITRKAKYNIKVGDSLNVVSYTVGDKLKAKWSKTDIRNSETPFVISIICILMALVLFLIRRCYLMIKG